MTRGDQRDRDRAKRQAKEASKNRGSQREGTPLQRNDADKAALEAKIAAKKAQKTAEAANGNSAKAPMGRTKVPKKQDNPDDLLNAGLTVKKGKK